MWNSLEKKYFFISDIIQKHIRVVVNELLKRNHSCNSTLVQKEHLTYQD